MYKLFFLKSYLFLFSILILGCQTTPKRSGTVRLHLTDAAFEKFKNKKLYLGYPPFFIDSVVVTQQKLILDPNNAKINYSKLYKVVYREDAKDGYYFRPLGFQDPYSKEPMIRSHFLIEDYDIEITIDELDIVKNSSFKGSKRNNPHFKQISIQFSTEKDQTIRDAIVASNLKKIGEYPTSNFILQQLYNNREKFTVSEIKQQVAAFHKAHETEELLDEFNKYYVHAGKINKVFPEGIVLPDKNGNPDTLQNKGGYQLLVFWASWCGPCRAEIPELKKIFQTYSPMGLEMISISIDADTTAWKTALEKEQMPWKQYLAEGDNLKKIKQYFTIPAIPADFLFSKNGEVIQEFTGYSSQLPLMIDSIYK